MNRSRGSKKRKTTTVTATPQNGSSLPQQGNKRNRIAASRPGHGPGPGPGSGSGAEVVSEITTGKKERKVKESIPSNTEANTGINTGSDTNNSNKNDTNATDNGSTTKVATNSQHQSKKAMFAFLPCHLKMLQALYEKDSKDSNDSNDSNENNNGGKKKEEINQVLMKHWNKTNTLLASDKDLETNGTSMGKVWKSIEFFLNNRKQISCKNTQSIQLKGILDEANSIHQHNHNRHSHHTNGYNGVLNNTNNVNASDPTTSNHYTNLNSVGKKKKNRVKKSNDKSNNNPYGRHSTNSIVSNNDKKKHGNDRNIKNRDNSEQNENNKDDNKAVFLINRPTLSFLNPSQSVSPQNGTFGTTNNMNGNGFHPFNGSGNGHGHGHGQTPFASPPGSRYNNPSMLCQTQQYPQQLNHHPSAFSQHPMHQNQFQHTQQHYHPNHHMATPNGGGGGMMMMTTSPFSSNHRGNSNYHHSSNGYSSINSNSNSMNHGHHNYNNMKFNSLTLVQKIIQKRYKTCTDKAKKKQVPFVPLLHQIQSMIKLLSDELILTMNHKNKHLNGAHGDSSEYDSDDSNNNDEEDEEDEDVCSLMDIGNGVSDEEENYDIVKDDVATTRSKLMLWKLLEVSVQAVIVKM